VFMFHRQLLKDYAAKMHEVWCAKTTNIACHDWACDLALRQRVHFYQPIGSSFGNSLCIWIDRTICNKILAQNTRGWSCDEKESCSDHKLISIGIELGKGRCNVTQRPGKRYYINANNWGAFNTTLEQRFIRTFDCQVLENNSTIKDYAICYKVKQCTNIGIYFSHYRSLWHHIPSVETQQTHK
jgi:hypothetical protein